MTRPFVPAPTALVRRLRLFPSVPGLGAEPFHDFVIDLEVSGDTLHVIAVVEDVEELEQGLGGALVDRHRILRAPVQARRLRRAEPALQGVADGAQVVRRADDLVPGLTRLDILGASFDRGLEHVVGRCDIGAIADHADPVEEEIDAARFTQIAAMFRESGT